MVGLRTRGDTPAHVVDVSAGGARIEVVPRLAPGEWVTVDLPSKPDEFRNGFHIPVSPADAERLGLPTGTVRGRVRAGTEQLPDGRYAVGVVFEKGFRGALRYWTNESLPTFALVLLIALLVPIERLEPSLLQWYRPVLFTYGLVVSLYLVLRLAVAVAHRPRRDSAVASHTTVHRVRRPARR